MEVNIKCQEWCWVVLDDASQEKFENILGQGMM